MLYRQSSESEKYLARCASLAPNTILQNANLYLGNRAVFLGLDSGVSMGPGMTAPMPVFNSPGPGGTAAPALTLRERIAAHGTGLVAALTVNGMHKKFIEDRVAEVVEALGGWDAVERTGEWGFLLDPRYNVRAANGAEVDGFELPSVPFNITKNGRTYRVNIIPKQDGSGDVSYTPVAAEEPPAPPQDNSDPL